MHSLGSVLAYLRTPYILSLYESHFLEQKKQGTQVLLQHWTFNNNRLLQCEGKGTLYSRINDA